MNALSGQILNGCSMLKEHPVDYEPLVEANIFEKSDSVRPIKTHNSRYDCSDPFLNHYNEDFLAQLSDLDQWKDDTSSVREEDPAGQSNSIGYNSEWNEIFNTMEWIDKFGPIDFTDVNSGSTLDYPDTFAHKQVDDMLEQAASLIDWKAWNCYLDSVADVKLEDYSKKVDDVGPLSLLEDTDMVGKATRIESKNSANSYESGCDFTDLSFSSDAELNERVVFPKSGPLTWLPSTEDFRNSSSAFSSQKASNVLGRVSKRRGVKMKPLGDEETNHRRLLNREAASRYRQRKRMEQSERKRELECLIYRNKMLKRHLRQVSTEINNLKKKIGQAKEGSAHEHVFYCHYLQT